MAEEALFARDALTTEFVLLDAQKTVAQGREELARAGATFGIVTSSDALPITLIDSGTLPADRDSDLLIESISKTSVFIVDSETLLEQVVSFAAQTLIENPEMTGLIVEDQGKVIGVLPRKVIRQYAQQIKTRGGDITELAGVPHVPAKYFVCPKQDYRKLIVRYDPDDPPTCPNHNLVLRKQP